MPLYSLVGVLVKINSKMPLVPLGQNLAVRFLSDHGLFYFPTPFLLMRSWFERTLYQL